MIRTRESIDLFSVDHCIMICKFGAVHSFIKIGKYLWIVFYLTHISLASLFGPIIDTEHRPRSDAQSDQRLHCLLAGISV